MMNLQISVSAKWYPSKKKKFVTYPAGWCCKSGNPKLETDRFKSYSEALDSYIRILKEKWISTWENTPQIDLSPPIVRGKADRFTVDVTGEFTLSLYENEVSVTWEILLIKPVNRTLDEFEPVLESARELSNLMKETDFTMTISPTHTEVGDEG